MTAAPSERDKRVRSKMVLPEGIELSTSPLPRECSTTELRQQTGIAEDGQILSPFRWPLL